MSIKSEVEEIALSLIHIRDTVVDAKGEEMINNLVGHVLCLYETLTGEVPELDRHLE